MSAIVIARSCVSTQQLGHTPSPCHFLVLFTGQLGNVFVSFLCAFGGLHTNYPLRQGAGWCCDGALSLKAIDDASLSLWLFLVAHANVGFSDMVATVAIVIT